MIQEILYEIRGSNNRLLSECVSLQSDLKCENGNEFKGNRCGAAEPLGAKTKSPASTVDSI